MIEPSQLNHCQFALLKSVLNWLLTKKFLDSKFNMTGRAFNDARNAFKNRLKLAIKNFVSNFKWRLRCNAYISPVTILKNVFYLSRFYNSFIRCEICKDWQLFPFEIRKFENFREEENKNHWRYERNKISEKLWKEEWTRYKRSTTPVAPVEQQPSIIASQHRRRTTSAARMLTKISITYLTCWKTRLDPPWLHQPLTFSTHTHTRRQQYRVPRAFPRTMWHRQRRVRCTLSMQVLTLQTLSVRRQQQLPEPLHQRRTVLSLARVLQQQWQMLKMSAARTSRASRSKMLWAT